MSSEPEKKTKWRVCTQIVLINIIIDWKATHRQRSHNSHKFAITFSICSEADKIQALSRSESSSINFAFKFFLFFSYIHLAYLFM